MAVTQSFVFIVFFVFKIVPKLLLVILNWASNKSVDVSNGQILVLDECDELFEEVPLEKIQETFLPEHYRTWMFSTTVDRQMEQPMNIKHYFVSCEFPAR